MATGLPVSRVVNVTVNLSPKSAVYRNFGALLIISSESVVDVNQRIVEYDGLDALASAFGVNSPTYAAADLFYSQVPQPQLCYVGRWAQTAAAGLLHGAILTPLQQQIAAFQAVTNGAMFVLVDGVPYALTGLNFSAANNLNGVAYIVQTALQAAGAAGARVIWGAINQRFDVVSGTTGVASSVSYVRAPTGTDVVTFTANPAAGSSLTLNGSAVTLVASAPTGNQALIGATLAATLTNLAQAINTSVDPQVSKFSAYATATQLYVWADAPGTAGNALTVAASISPALNGTVLNPTLVGGAGTDISVLLGLSVTPTATGSNASQPVPGVAPESLTQAVKILDNQSGLWYGAMVATATPPSDADHTSAAAYVEGATQARIYGITTQNTNVLDGTRSDDICSVLQSLGFSRTFIQYSSSSPYAVASMFGRAFTVNFDGSNTTLTLKFKQEPGVVAEYLTSDQANVLESKNCNVFVAYANDTAIIEQGVMANGYFFDERHGADWLQNRLQTDLFNLLYTSPTKIPQTDDGQHLLLGQCNASVQAAVTNGLVAPGVWNAAGFGVLAQGDTLTTGYYFYSDSYANQSQANRDARKAMPIQGAVKLAGAIHSVDCAVLVNR
jgi:hypothetical protein